MATASEASGCTSKSRNLLKSGTQEREKDEDAEKLRRHSIREEVRMDPALASEHCALTRRPSVHRQQLAKARAYQEMTDEEKVMRPRLSAVPFDWKRC